MASRPVERVRRWAGYCGAGEREALRHALGSAARCLAGDGCALATLCEEDAAGDQLVQDAEQVVLTAGHGADLALRLVLDLRTSRLTASAGPFGLRSVYFLEQPDTLWFASDPQTLGRLPGAANVLSAEALHAYLIFSCVPPPNCILEGVRTLPAGAVWVAERAILREVSRETWQVPTGGVSDEAEAVPALRALLRTAVETRLPANREPVGVFLSGGLDSSLIAAFLVEAGADVRLYSLDFGPSYPTELPYARTVAAHLGLPLTVARAEPEDVAGAFTAAGAAQHQPFGDAVTVPLYLLGKAAAGTVHTVFNGEGGDQLFGGWANKPMLAAALYASSSEDDVTTYMATFHRFYGLLDRICTPGARRAAPQYDPRNMIREALAGPGRNGWLHRLRAANLTLKGAQNIAPRAVQLARAHGLRPASPFFDEALARWTFGLGPELLLQGSCEKYLLKRVAEACLPVEIVWREKRGMGVPATEWLLGPLGSFVRRRLNPLRLRRDGWFSASAVAALRAGLDPHSDYRARRVGEKLWAVLMLHVWCDAQPVRPSWFH